MTTTHALAVCSVLASSLAFAPLARAQNVDLQHFEPSATTTGLTTVKGAEAEGWLAPTASLSLTYVHDPLIAVGRDREVLGAIVDHRLDAILGFALGLTPKSRDKLPLLRGADVAVLLPIVPFQHGTSTPHGIYSGRARPAAVSGSAHRGKIGGAHPRSVRGRSRAHSGLELPASTGGRFLGSDSLVFTPEIAASTVRGPLFFGANLGWRVRGNKQLYGMEVADQLVWRAGAGADLHGFGAPERLSAAVELFVWPRAPPRSGTAVRARRSSWSPAATGSPRTIWSAPGSAPASVAATARQTSGRSWPFNGRRG